MVGSIVFLSIFIPSNGTEPRDACTYVVGTNGLIPLNPNEGGTVSYSCDPNFGIIVFYILWVSGAVTITLNILKYAYTFLRRK